MTTPMIEAESVSRSFGRTSVLNEVSLTVGGGTICSLLGPNGAGKTTLLKILMGLVHPTAGTAALLSCDRFPRSAESLSNTGCLIDGYEPPPGTRVKHLLSLTQAVSPGFDETRALQLLAGNGVSIQSPWRRLSKGQKRWTLLATQLCRGCRVLLLDEPADGLDPQTRRQLYELIRAEASERGTAVLIATHILPDIERITDEVCILQQGRIILHDELEVLREQMWRLELSEKPSLPPEVEVLGNADEESLTVLVRDRGSRLPAELPEELRRRRVSLEEMYFAITATGAIREKPHDSTAELVPG